VGAPVVLGLGEQAGDTLGGQAAGHVGVRGEHLGRSLSVRCWQDQDASLR
jgi:hypothetical protein